MLWAGIFYEEAGGRILLRAMPVMLGTLCVLAIAYRYYSAFLAARVAALDDSRPTPAHTLSTTARTTIPPANGCCSAITSPPSPAPGRSSGRCWRFSTATCRDCSGW